MVSVWRASCRLRTGALRGILLRSVAVPGHSNLSRCLGTWKGHPRRPFPTPLRPRTPTEVRGRRAHSRTLRPTPEDRRRYRLPR